MPETKISPYFKGKIYISILSGKSAPHTLNSVNDESKYNGNQSQTGGFIIKTGEIYRSTHRLMLVRDSPQPAQKYRQRVPKAGKSLEKLGRAWHNVTGNLNTLGAWRGRVSSLRPAWAISKLLPQRKIKACECKREGRRKERDPKWKEEDERD